MMHAISGRIRRSVAATLMIFGSTHQRLHFNVPYNRCSLNRDLHRSSSNPGRAHLNRGPSFCHAPGHPKVHLVAVQRAGEADCSQHLGGFAIHLFLDGRIDSGQRTGRKGCPGSTAGTVGPSPVANRDKISPAAAGLDEVTREKSLECVTADPLAVAIICGADIGMRWATHRCAPPPLRRRFAGSSVIEADRWTDPPGAGATTPICPRTPRNAPVPPVIAKLLPPVTVKGDPGGASPPGNPSATMVPIGVPSLFRISKVTRATAFRTVSESAWPGLGCV